MRRRSTAKGVFVDDFPIMVDIDAMRRAAGGRRRLRTKNSLMVTLDGACEVQVEIVHHAWRWGSQRPFLLCPCCQGRRANTLRRVPQHPFLACTACVRQVFGVKYRSQARSSGPSGTPRNAPGHVAQGPDLSIPAAAPAGDPARSVPELSKD